MNRSINIDIAVQNADWAATSSSRNYKTRIIKGIET